MFAVQVSQIVAKSDDVYLVFLQALSPVPLFQAGQYLSLKTESGVESYFSIASKPDALHFELHIQAGPDNLSAQQLLADLKAGSQAWISAPAGDCHLGRMQDPDASLLLVCSGTGFSQMKSVLEQLQADQDPRPVHLYWAARQSAGLYLLDLPEAWLQSWPQFRFSALISAHLSWDGLHGALDRVILAEHPDLSHCQVMVCGSGAMVWHTHDVLAAAGLPAGRIFSDVFAFQPRA